MTAVLDNVKEIKSALRAKLSANVAELDEITNSFKIEDGNVVASQEAGDRFAALVTESKGIKTQLGEFGELESLRRELKHADEEIASTSLAAQGAAALAALRAGGGEYKSVGQRFIESDVYKNRASTGVTGSWELDEDIAANPMERKDIYTSAGGTLTRYAFGETQREPIVQRPYRTSRVRDLFPVAGTTAALIEYVRVLGFLDGANNAATVAERTADDTNFGLKPQTKLKLAPAQAPLRTIAHYELAHRNTLNDDRQLRSIIDTELLYGLRLVEDAQLLNGDGQGENILGILRTPGVQRYPGSPIPTPSPVQAKDTYLDAVRRAATRVMMAYYEPTGVVVHPFDWERMETTKDDEGRYLLTVNVAVGAQKTVWTMPVVASPAMTEGTALVGAFGLGAKVYDREQANIRIAEQHDDLFLRNAVAILAEERIGLTVPRPESFVKVDLEAGSA